MTHFANTGLKLLFLGVFRLLMGAKIVKDPQDAFWGGYHGYFQDPDGHLSEIAWNPYEPAPAS